MSRRVRDSVEWSGGFLSSGNPRKCRKLIESARLSARSDHGVVIAHIALKAPAAPA